MNTEEVSIAFLNSVPDASSGLGEHLFHAISRLTPMVNVDLLVQKTFQGKRHTLLSWREDDFYIGWHFPGGIVRFKEKLLDRIIKVSEDELSSEVIRSEGPLAINEITNPERDVRGHFISFLYSVELSRYPQIQVSDSDETLLKDTFRWFVSPPPDLLKQHFMYRGFF